MSEGEEKKPGAPEKAESGKTGETPKEVIENEEGRKDVFDLGLDDRQSFKMIRKNLRHYVAHEEYGVIFSYCGIRITKKQVEYNPPKLETELRCEKCKRHIWEIIASEQYAARMKEKKDLGE